MLKITLLFKKMKIKKNIIIQNMIINMFIIPVLTISSGKKTLYELFTVSGYNIARLLSELFIPKSAEFFIILLV